ncbi:MAG: transcription elongation factor GreA [Patescibacteria group bacterium]
MHYISQEKYNELKKEFENLKNIKIPDIAKKIDEARQQGDLSENAEYHAAREEMAWAKGREIEIGQILENSEIIEYDKNSKVVQVGSKIVVEKDKEKREYEIVGPQEADPLNGKISNESPLGNIFLGKKKGDSVELKLANGSQKFKILTVN